MPPLKRPLDTCWLLGKTNPSMPRAKIVRRMLHALPGRRGPFGAKVVFRIMNTVNLTQSYDAAFVHEVEAATGQVLSTCYQCGNCTAGCPYTFVYDIPVSQIMRLLQAGQKDTVLSCNSIWLCASCQSCTTRCPNNIEVAQIMDTLRHLARRKGFAKPQRPVRTFWDSFLASVRRHGRVFEMGTVAEYVLKTGRFWSDVDLGPKILPKGKLHFKPHDIQGKDEVARIFERFEQEFGPQSTQEASHAR